MVWPTLHAVVRGRVQGVYFRASAAKQARDVGIGGWVRNLPDGTVEAFAQGDRHALEEFLRWLGEGPPSARVDEVSVTWGTAGDPPPPDFRITD
jgi:acylphosphatase